MRTPDPRVEADSLRQHGRCICDGAAYEPDQRHPFLVHPGCPRHGTPRPTAGVESITEQHDREVAARALRDAAEELDLPGSTAGGYYASEQDSGYHEAERHAEDWLRSRADRIAAGVEVPS